MVQGGSDAATIIPMLHMWLAGGGVAAASRWARGRLGFNVVKNRVHVATCHATLLHLLGLDHQRLTFKFQGLDAKLTGVEAATWCRDRA